MIDLDDVFRGERGEEDARLSVRAFFAKVIAGLLIERRMSVLVRLDIGGTSRDFRITYMGPSRPRREARRPTMTASSKEQQR